MLKKKWISGAAVAAIATSLFVAGPTKAQTEVINEKWGKPTVVYGGGLSESQVSQTAQLLKITNSEQVHTLKATGDDLVKYLGGRSGDTSSMISSVMVQKLNKGNGVDVNILTPENITLITAEQYANAAITAGVTDAKIDVASVSKVTGESALTGVYKAFEANGEKIDTNRSAVAQQELETTNSIAQANKNNTNFNPAALDQAMVEIKQSLAELKERTGQLATREQIEEIVNKALQNNQLNSIISNEYVTQIINFAISYQETGAIDSQEVQEQLKKLSNDLSQQVNQIVQQAQNEGWLDQISAFFTNLLNQIQQFFNSVLGA